MYKTNAAREVYIIGSITMENLPGQMETIKKIYEQDPSEWITLYLTSEGGSTYAGFALYEFLMRLEAKIQTVGLGSVDSIAPLIFLAGEHRVISSGTTLIFHETGRSYEKIRLSTSDHKRIYLELRGWDNRYAKIIEQRTGTPMKKIKAIIRSDIFVLSAEQCLKFGFAHEILPG